MSERPVTVSTWTPPRWLNAIVGFMLRTPPLQGWLGRTTGLMTFTGRRSGRRFTTPVTYYRDGDTVTLLTQKFRNWWRNFETRPEVELRLAGRVVRGQAEARVGDDAMLPTLIAFLDNRPRDAKYYGVTIGPDGKVNEDSARALLPQVVVIRVALE